MAIKTVTFPVTVTYEYTFGATWESGADENLTALDYIKATIEDELAYLHKENETAEELGLQVHTVEFPVGY